MKASSFRKDLVRSIVKSRGRFFSVMAIIFLGVSFFAGINATEPDMVLSADKYYKEQNLSDFRIISPLGFKEEDLQALGAVEGVTRIQKGFYKDLFLVTPAGTTSVVKLMSYDPKDFQGEEGLNAPYLLEGRLPEAPGEILLESGLGVPRELSLGDVVTATVSGEEDVREILARTSFTVVGVASSPLHVNYERGQTNIGDGSIAYFAYIHTEDFALSAYNEAYVRIQGSQDLLAYDPAYRTLIQGPEQAMEDLGRRAMARETRSLREELEEGKAAFLEGKATAEREIAEGEQKLLDAEAAILEGEQTLAENEERYTREIAEGRAELKAGREELERGKMQYFDGYTSWLEGYNTYQDGRQTLQEAKYALDLANVRLEAGEREVAAGKRDLEAARTQLALVETVLDALVEIRDNLPEGDTELTEEEYQAVLEDIRQVNPDLARIIENSFPYNDPNVVRALRASLSASILELEKNLEDGRRQVTEGEAAIAEAEAELAEGRRAYEAGLRDYNRGVAQLDDAQGDIDSAKAQLDIARGEIEDGEEALRRGEEELDAAEIRLAEELLEGRIALEEAREEVAAGWITFQREKADALEKIAEAEAEIRDAERQLLELPSEWFLFTRYGNPGYSSYGDDADRIGAVAKVFPLFFFLVAALVCLTTMTRMIEEERTQIGTLKALGYGSLLISSKYLVYALLASFIGAVLGMLLGFQLFPRIIMSLYGGMYDIPHMLSPFHWDYALLSLAIAVVTTVSAALTASLNALRSTPAYLMQPKAPKPGKRIFLERMGFLWERLNFTQKVTARNLFRYKRRFFMTVIGIAGCSALLLTGYGIRDSVGAIMERQFEEIFLYDGMVLVDAKVEEPVDFAAILEGQRDITQYTAAMMESVTVFKDRAGRNFEVNLLVPEEDRSFRAFFDLRERVSKTPLPLSPEGAVVTEKLASLLDISVGDTLEYRDTENRTYAFQVAGIAENYMAHYVFFSKEYFDRVTLRDPLYNAGIFNLEESFAFDESLFREGLMEEEGVIGILLTSAFREEFYDTLFSLDGVVLILILAAGALAFVVLYNLTNINITERMREIATIKVLGFRDREVSSYVYRENVILAFVGTLTGLLLGFLLHRFVIQTMEVDNMMFGKDIRLLSYGLSVVLTMAFAFMVNFIMFFKLRSINMVESLKSVE